MTTSDPFRWADYVRDAANAAQDPYTQHARYAQYERTALYSTTCTQQLQYTPAHSGLREYAPAPRRRCEYCDRLRAGLNEVCNGCGAPIK